MLRVLRVYAFGVCQNSKFSYQSIITFLLPVKLENHGHFWIEVSVKYQVKCAFIPKLFKVFSNISKCHKGSNSAESK